MNIDSVPVLPKELLDDLECIVLALDPHTNELIYANNVGKSVIDDPNNINYHCYKNIFTNSTATCVAYQNVSLGIPNRRKFDFDFRALLSDNIEGVLVMINLKGFSSINNQYGFDQANNLLVGIASHLRDNLPVKDAVYHTGSDKFLFLLPNISEDDLKLFLSELSTSFETAWNLGGVYFPVNCDISAIRFPEHGTTATELLQNLASALDISRRSNIVNTITYFSRSIHEKVQKRAELEWAMLRAVSDGCKEFEVYFQPIIRASDMKWAGCEALMRWNSTEFGFLSPASFLTVAEHTGLISTLGNFVLKTSIEFIQGLGLPASAPFHLSINLSPKQLYDTSLVADIKKILDQTGFPAEDLVVELGDLKEKDKENALVIKNLADLKSLNTGVALDDFGLDNSGIYDFTDQRGILKIGRHITANIETDEFMQTFMRTVVDLSKVMNLDVCVKGIETDGQFDFMKAYAPTFLQGYYFSIPLSAAEFKDLMPNNI